MGVWIPPGFATNLWVSGFLAKEPADRRLVTLEFGVRYAQRHLAIQRRIERTVNRAAASGSRRPKVPPGSDRASPSRNHARPLNHRTPGSTRKKTDSETICGSLH